MRLRPLLLALALVLVAASAALAEPGGGGEHAFLGVGTEASADGVTVTEVLAGSPAEHAGLAVGDVIARIDSVSPTRPEDVIDLVRHSVPGHVVTMQVRHAGSIVTLRATLAPLPHELESPAPSALVGSQAPELSLDLLRGPDPVRLAQLRGRVVLLDFWATWCGPCRAVMPALDALGRQYHDQGLTVLGVSDEPRARITAHLDRTGFAYTFGRDTGGTAHRFGVRAVPTLVVVDRTGRVREVEEGVSAASVATLTQTIRQLLAEHAP